MSSIFETVTVEQFKEYFFRDFPFAPYWNDAKTYAKDDVVLYEKTFYKSLINNNTDAPTVTTSWQTTTGNMYDYILDEDIEKAMTQARMNGNSRFGDSCAEKINIYLHLVAYYLVIDLKNSSTGINSSYVGTVASKSVGDVSESYAIPQWLQSSPMYSMFSQNGYGLKYLSMITPYLAVTIMYSRGDTTIG